MTRAKPTFYESVHCTAAVHCATCRSTGAAGQSFRAAMLAQFPELGAADFACPQQRRWGWQFGDLVAKVATPVARALGLDCIDTAKQELKPESPCAKRKAWMNAMWRRAKPVTKGTTV